MVTLLQLADVLLSAVILAVVVAQRPQPDPVADLTQRLRHPLTWKLQHPVRALVRLF
jgi:hypothetical protein